MLSAKWIGVHVFKLLKGSSKAGADEETRCLRGIGAPPIALSRCEEGLLEGIEARIRAAERDSFASQ